MVVVYAGFAVRAASLPVAPIIVRYRTEEEIELPQVSPPPPHKANTLTIRNGNLNPPDVYPKDIWVPLQNQANRVGMVLTAESP